MDPFTIQCSTCGSNIRVRNPALVGQLANCPKCQSMIMIAAPGQVTVEPQAGMPADSMAMTKEVAPPKEFGEVAAQPGEEAVPDDDYRLAPVDVPLGAQAPPTPSEPEWHPSDTPLVPSGEWSSANSTKSRHFLLIGFLGFTGVLVAAGGFFAFLNWYSNTSDVAVKVEPKNPGVDPIQDPKATNETDAARAPEGLNPSSPDPADHIDLAQPVDNGTENVGQTPDENTGAGNVLSGEKPPEGDSALVGNEGVKPSTSNPAVDPADPMDGGEESGANSEDEDSADTPKSALQQLIEDSNLNAYQVTLSSTNDGPLPTEPPVTAADLGLSTTISREPIQPTDIKAQYELGLAGIVLRGQPPTVSKLLNLWTHLSGVPVVVDFDSLAAAGIDRNQAVKLPVQIDKSIGETTAQIASSVGALGRVIENRYVVLRSPAGLLSEKLPGVYPLEGLVGEGEQDWLLTTLADFFPITRGKLSFEPNGLAYDASLDLTAWIQVVQLLESWRAAAGMSAGVDLPTHAQLLTHFLTSDEVPGLEKVCTLISPQERPVGQTLSRVCGDAGIHCWIDWASVGAVGLGPETAEVVMTHGRQLRRVLANYADKFPLEIAILDESSIVLMSRSAYRASVHSYVTSAQGDSAEVWKSRLRDLTPAGDNVIGAVQAILSPDGQFVLLRCCRPTVDQCL